MPPLTLTILGSGTAAPNEGGACSGYLLRHGDTAVVMDCGSGVAGRIAQHTPTSRLTGVVISHLHPDHYFDLVPLYYILRSRGPRPAELGPKVPLYMPPGGREFLHKLGELIASKSAMLDDIFEIGEYGADCEREIGDLRFTFHPVQHYVLSHAIRVRSASGATLVFSSDVGPCPQVIEAARGADLFMCESTLLDPKTQDEYDPARRGHMSAGEAGNAARAAGARKLLLTHYRAGEPYEAQHMAAAGGAFGGPVELAREGQTYPVG